MPTWLVLGGVLLLALPPACGGDSISMGWDDPEPRTETFSCTAMSCGNSPPENPMCAEGRWGTYACNENPMVAGTCAFQASCEQLTPCTPADCPERPSEQAMCNGGFRDWVCDAEGDAACSWVVPPGCLAAP